MTIHHINLTPHDINIFSADKILAKTVKPDGTVARIETKLDYKFNLDGICYSTQKVGATIGLPNPIIQDGIKTYFIVSAMVRESNPSREDLASPGELIRNDKGQPIGCLGLIINN